MVVQRLSESISCLVNVERVPVPTEDGKSFGKPVTQWRPSPGKERRPANPLLPLYAILCADLGVDTVLLVSRGLLARN